MSRIGKQPIVIPKNVKVTIEGNCVSIEGPLGILKHRIPECLYLELKDTTLIVKRERDDKEVRNLHGLTRSLIFNMVKGVTEGYSKELEIVGMGFKAELKNNQLVMHLGFSHPVIFNFPKEIKIEVPKPTHIKISGIDKQLVGEVAAKIRHIYPPEPYKGKGIRYSNE
ncbi:MAG: 50S ribosomal protein L6, partial [Candidatus Omnitrophica bacterium]|nr:50S ribosomal protein L6 [Candidatus Omnitrophota bacterium]